MRVPDQILIEKRKWDGSVASREEATLVRSKRGTLVWVVEAGRTRVKPRQGTLELVSDPEVWVASREYGFVTCACAGTDDSIDSVEVHAALLPRVRARSKLIWVDLDLDLRWDPVDHTVSLEDFEDLIRRWDEMHYPDQLVRKAWDAIGEALTRIHSRDWPFDGAFEAYGREARAKTQTDAEGAQRLTRRAARVARLVGGHIGLH